MPPVSKFGDALGDYEHCSSEMQLGVMIVKSWRL